ncbi:uncharacterized protein BDV17DRAFT_238726 [Aspergillus undulatus]|uniref:uncharacterized protein n=1 Tax=Aspergillus undulatus TaxID=1810928 RepID=UPI003CCD24A9
MGAMYRLEYATGHQIYEAVRSILDHPLQKRRRDLVDQLTKQSPAFAGTRSALSDSPRASNRHLRLVEDSGALEYPQSDLHSIQALITLSVISAWGQRSLVQESMVMSSQLASLVRDLGLNELDDASCQSPR